MKKLLKFSLFVCGLAVFVGVGDGFCATKTAKKQSAIQIGTKVRTKVDASGVYDKKCYESYFGCMDQFCIVDNELGGSCNCNDDIKQYESALSDIRQMLSEAERISTEEVEKVKAGANADIIFQGTRTYDENGEVIATKATKDRAEAAKSMWSSFYDTDYDEDDEEYDMMDLISDKTGNALYNAAHKLCVEQMDSSCAEDMSLLTQMYSRQIVSDCKGLANSIDQKKQEAKTMLSSANASVRAALKESLDEANKYDRGTCMVEYKKCMRSEDACGPDWEQCVFTIASENMQNKKSNSVAGTSVITTDTYDITASTMEILEAKRYICENVLDKCVANRRYIWNDFLREAAPTIRLAESNIESKKRQSCLKDISDCIQTACKDDIVGKGVATMDACLARPTMARSFCKVQLDPCERMEPQIWDYVESKLAAMRVDACTQEVKECFTSEDRCGTDFMNCIGMDFNYIHDICPIDKLVVCKQANPDFKMSDLDSMLMGLYLNIDNQALENCQKIAEEKMVELCGSTTDCNSFASDEYLGTGSVRSQKDGTIYRVTGMISFGSIKMGDAAGSVRDGKLVLKPGEIGVEDYIAEVKKKNKTVPGADGIISSIEEELKNISGTINHAISLIESDTRIQYCINGRDLSQINGKENKRGENQTVARFPNLLNQYRTMIGMAALRKAQDNYNKKIASAIEEAAHNSSAEVAQFMCQKLGDMGNTSFNLNSISEQSPLTTPFAISYDVGTGLTTKSLLQGGYGKIKEGAETFKYRGRTSMNSGYTKETRATFDKATRKCHICTTTTTTSCKNMTKYFRSESDCQVNAGEPICEDVQM